MTYELTMELRGGDTLEVRMGGQHSLTDLYQLAVAHLGLEDSGWVLYLDWPYPDPKVRLTPDHPTLSLPIEAIGLEVRQGFVIEVHERQRVNLFVEAVDGRPGPASPEVVRATPWTLPHHMLVRRRLSALAVVPAPEGLDADRLQGLRAALQALFELEERRYGRRPGPAPEPHALGLAMLEACRAWSSLLGQVADKGQLAHVAASMGRAHRPPDSLLREVLRWPWGDAPPPDVEAVLCELCEGLRPLSGEWVVVQYSHLLVRTGQPERAVALLLAHGSGPRGPGAAPEQIVSVAEALAQAGAHLEANRRLAAVAARVWGSDDQRQRARTLLRESLSAPELEAEQATWEASDRRREQLLART